MSTRRGSHGELIYSCTDDINTTPIISLVGRKVGAALTFLDVTNVTVHCCTTTELDRASWPKFPDDVGVEIDNRAVIKGKQISVTAAMAEAPFLLVICNPPIEVSIPPN